jgi:hypothetical protein
MYLRIFYKLWRAADLPRSLLHQRFIFAILLRPF